MHHLLRISSMLVVLYAAFELGMIGFTGHGPLVTRAQRYGTHGRILLILIGVAGLYLASRRDTLFPSMGDCSFPTKLLGKTTSPLGAAVTNEILTSPEATAVLYWAAVKSADNPADAYGEQTNSGLATVVDRKAQVKMHCPGVYKTGKLHSAPRHFHYREVHGNSMLGPLQTKRIQCN